MSFRSSGPPRTPLQAAGCECICLRPARLLGMQKQTRHSAQRPGRTPDRAVPVVAGCIVLSGVQVLCSPLQLLTLFPGVHNQAPDLLGLIQQLQHRTGSSACSGCGLPCARCPGPGLG